MADLPRHPHAALAERYRIERELGRGGMAVVYLAHDLAHDRQVALKVIRPELAALLGPDRFLREIQITGRLTHPHIAQLHDAGRVEGVLYYSMPYVESGSLRERLARERQLAVDDAVGIALELAHALDYAHREGVVHRDLTPENIMLKDGHAMVVDFGVAKAIDVAGGKALTTSGFMIGTPGYMSPEQARGAAADGRGDLYSLGCVLYEMLAGQPPFTGPTLESVLHQHAAVEPRPVTDLRPSTPLLLAQVVTQLLAKAPADRIGSGAEVARALEAAVATPTAVAEARTADKRRRRVSRRWIVAAVLGVLVLAVAAAWRLDLLPGVGPPPPPSRRGRVVVAEFEAPDSTLRTIVRNLVSLAIAQSQIVTPIRRGEVRFVLEAMDRPPDTQLTPSVARELARRLAVPVVEGRVVRMGQGYQVNVEITDAIKSQVVASLSERAKNDDELIDAAGRIGRKLRRSLGEHPRSIRSSMALPSAVTPSLEAMRLSRRAGAAFNRFDTQTAIQLYRQALALDPNYAQVLWTMGAAFDGLGEADSALLYRQRAVANSERVEPRLKTLIEEQLAVSLEDYPRALALLNYGISQWPDATGFYNDRGYLFSILGRFEEALSDFRTAATMQGEFNPTPWSAANVWAMLLSLGRVEEAEQWTAKLRVGPQSRQAPMWNSLAASQWSRAESLGTSRLEDPFETAQVRADGGLIVAATSAARGAIGVARQALDRTQSVLNVETSEFLRTLRVWLLLDLVSGSVHEPRFRRDPADTSAVWLGYQAIREAALGDTTAAQSLLERLEHRPSKWAIRTDICFARALNDWRAGRWEGVVSQLGRPARTLLFEGRLMPVGLAHSMCWMVSDAWERLGQADSAAAYSRVALATLEADHLTARAIIMPFAHQRLVMLYAQMGRWQEARAHWEALAALVTQPDAEFRPRLAEARQTIAGAESMVQSARRSN